MKLKSKLLVSLGKRTGNVVLRRELADLGSASHLSEGLKELMGEGRLVRLGEGLYAKARPDQTGKGEPLISLIDLAREAFAKLGIQLRAVTLNQEAGRPILLVDTGSRRIGRKLDFAGARVRYLQREDSAGDSGVLPLDLDALPIKGVGRYVERLARVHGVQHVRSGLDDYAEAVTRAAGDEVVLDATGKLLVALKKKELITGRQAARLMTNHIREIKRVRSVRRLRKRGLSSQR